MTTLKLFLFILVAVLLQLLLLVAVLVYRQWSAYRQLKQQCYGAVPATKLVSAEPWKGLRQFQVQRKVFEDDARSICSFYLVPVDGQPLHAFRPGQYLTFEFDIPDVKTGQLRKLVRCYSLSDKPGQDYYRITVKKLMPPPDQPGLSPGQSSTYLHEQVQQGDVLSVKAPAGHFYWSPEVTEPLVLIAGGIGITPVLSMLFAALEHNPGHEIWFFYGVRNGTEHIMKPDLQALVDMHPGLRLHVCYSRAGPGEVLGKDYHHDSRVDISLLRQTLPLKSFRFYVCGPRPMMESLVPALADWGVPDHQIHYEAFGPASINRPIRPVSNEVLTVTFSRSGKSVTWDDSCSCLLELAEMHGIELDYGCRAGSCGSCQTVIEAGEVTYNQEPDADVAAGSCLLCIARPVTNLTLAV